MNGLKQITLRFSFITLLVLFLAPSCKDDFNSSIPYTYVNFRVNLINYNDLTVPGNAVFFPAGYGGVIVMFNGISYYAFDAACPYEIDTSCKIEVDGGIGTCPCCGSQYNLFDGGYVIKGPSSEQLKVYNISQSDNTLFITN